MHELLYQVVISTLNSIVACRCACGAILSRDIVHIDWRAIVYVCMVRTRNVFVGHSL